jgi:hypothetical protein
MSGGIGFALLLIILVVAIVVGVALYLTGGALWFSRTGVERETEERPRFKRVDMPPEEHVTLAGTESGEREHRERMQD